MFRRTNLLFFLRLQIFALAAAIFLEMPILNDRLYLGFGVDQVLKVIEHFRVGDAAV